MLTFIPVEKPTKKYKRVLWAGVRTKEPVPTDMLYPDNRTEGESIEDAIDLEREDLPNFRPAYPCLVVWENNSGEEKFIEVNDPDAGTKKVD